MKKKYLVILALVLTTSIFAQTYGHLNVNFTSSQAGGNYAPRNIVAVWVEDANGNFVKTLMAYAQNRITHLNTWQAATVAAGSEYNRIDAITGSTRTSHASRSCVWNALDYNQNLMPDGTYYLWMELTDKNGTGNYHSFEFIKGEDAQQLTPADVPSFSDIIISWEPSGTGIIEASFSNVYNISNNPGPGKYEISGSSFDEYEVRSISGELVQKSKASVVDLSDQANGIYLLRIYNKEKLHIIKLIKR